MVAPSRKSTSKKPVSKNHPTKTTLLIVAILLAAAGIAYYALVYRPKQLALQTTNSPSQIVTPAPGTQPEPDVPVVNDPYLNVPEWGVRIKLPPELQGDVTYIINDYHTKKIGAPPTLDFLSKKFSAGSFKCAVVEGDYPRVLVSVSRLYIQQGVDVRTQYYPSPFAVHNDYAYRFDGSYCEEAILREGSDADRALLNTLKQAVQNTLEQTP